MTDQLRIVLFIVVVFALVFMVAHWLGSLLWQSDYGRINCERCAKVPDCKKCRTAIRNLYQGQVGVSEGGGNSMKCSTCGKCKECGSGVVWTGLSPAGNANAAAMNHVYHTIPDATVTEAATIVVNQALPAAGVGQMVTLTVPSPCSDCGK